METGKGWYLQELAGSEEIRGGYRSGISVSYYAILHAIHRSCADRTAVDILCADGNVPISETTGNVNA